MDISYSNGTLTRAIGMAARASVIIESRGKMQRRKDRESASIFG